MADSESYLELKKARSLLLLLVATCEQTLLALDAAGNVLDSEMTEALRAMIARSEKEILALTAKVNDAAS